MKKDDERAILLRRKINSRAFGYAFVALWCFLLYRIYYLHQSHTEYMDILLLQLGLTVYVTFRTMKEGIYNKSYQSASKNRISIIVTHLLLTLAFMVCFIFISGMNNP